MIRFSTKFQLRHFDIKSAAIRNRNRDRDRIFEVRVFLFQTVNCHLCNNYNSRFRFR
ncbi:MAG: hypothetical protein [Olavius algarvensis Delta 4 endosymbiont]|nr:MAG: hypothetical protein [Olavius algarvensis Delta 4 endosymbiont]